MISYSPVGVASRSGLIGFVVKVVCCGCHPSGCFGGMGGVVRVFLRVGAFVVLYLSIVVLFPARGCEYRRFGHPGWVPVDYEWYG